MKKKSSNLKERRHSLFNLNKSNNITLSMGSKDNNNFYNDLLSELEKEKEDDKEKIIKNNKIIYKNLMNEKFSPNKSNKKSRFEEGKEINKNKHDILNLNSKNNLYQTNFQCIPHRLLSDNAMLKRTHLLLTEKTSKPKIFREKIIKDYNFNSVFVNNDITSSLIFSNKVDDNTRKNINDKIIDKIENKKKSFLCCF